MKKSQLIEEQVLIRKKHRKDIMLHIFFFLKSKFPRKVLTKELKVPVFEVKISTKVLLEGRRKGNHTDSTN